MKIRLTLVALVSAISLPVLADSAFVPVGGEAGTSTHPMQSMTSSSAVHSEMHAWDRNPVSADGWRNLGGEAGSVFVGQRSAGKATAAPQQMSKRFPANGWVDMGGEAGSVYVGA